MSRMLGFVSMLNPVHTQHHYRHPISAIYQLRLNFFSILLYIAVFIPAEEEAFVSTRNKRLKSKCQVRKSKSPQFKPENSVQAKVKICAWSDWMFKTSWRISCLPPSLPPHNTNQMKPTPMPPPPPIPLRNLLLSSPSCPPNARVMLTAALI